ncbi:MAG TPA: TetR/AcrR family transcriptional regulator [Deltaproteobacteria bacterium]|nr:TetR/AcrR family transcriptional regulator [Deltaproteobacteria bacterium]HPR55654.1 TetR/AcrR family transcriptional regulator [Deltaproteobacteria bacterium]HXK47427.1 TetR/AcrR family transcriptional regulator [Deltaproteobacteria bacterium]
MPKQPASPQVVEAIRERILTEALSIINEEGYANLSMRKLARRLGVTAKTIYNYYSNKDELYLMALIEGFQDLTEQFRAAYRSSGDPVERLRAALHAYVDWGIEHRHSYNIMFSMDTPKYADYMGTRMEQIAERQNRIALQVAEIATAILTEVATRNGSLDPDDVPYRLLHLWSTLHGMVSLYISRVTLEVWDLQGAMDRILDDVLRPYTCERPTGNHA